MLSVNAYIKDFIHLLEALSLKRLANLIQNRLSYMLTLLTRHYYKPLYPVSLAVEPTAFCNLKCPHCPSGNGSMVRGRGYMKPELFQKIIGDASPHIMYLTLYFQGEPFLNRHIYDFIRLARTKKIYTTTSTNAMLINDTVAKKIVESAPDKIIISLDGITQDTYATYRTGGEVSKVINAIERLVYHKKQLKSSRPFIEVQFLVFRHNEHEMVQAKNLALELGADKISFKTAQLYNIENNDFMVPQNPKFSRYKKGKDGSYELKKRTRNRCYRMWSSPVITWDGFLVPCCYDKDAMFSMGNIGQTTLKSLWQSDAFENFRKEVLKKRKQIAICCNCGE